MRNVLVSLWFMLLCSITSVAAQVSVGIGLPGVSIGINLPVYPELVPVPGYPVYYAPQVSSNYFFYDGMYWVYQRDNWYASSWYNGPWGLVVPEAVPLFVLRVPVRYYRRPPAYFRGWHSDAPPRWGEHWGNSWEQRRSGWDMWDRGAVPAPAPLPVYQRQYSGNRYPRVEQQQVLQTQNYRYQPQDAVVRQHYQAQPVQSAPAPSPQARQSVPQERSATQDQRASARHRRSRKTLHRHNADNRRKRGAEMFKGPQPRRRFHNRGPRIQANSSKRSSRRSVSNRRQGRKARTTDRRASPQRRPCQSSISPSNRSKPSVRPSRRSKALPSIRNRRRGRKVRTKHRNARDPRRNQLRARRRALTKVSSKVGSTINETNSPRRDLLFPRRIERKEAIDEIEMSIRATGAPQFAHRRQHLSLRHEYCYRATRRRHR